ncbi:hypothetical protein CDS [Bradyrhizobium sp.]|nr:hypothetical protein CDS [Bradyrhizobium sp.]
MISRTLPIASARLRSLLAQLDQAEQNFVALRLQLRDGARSGGHLRYLLAAARKPEK